ncbi:hypothetical protein ACFL38_04300 [Candidatus Omnitrophota bacterium]
MAIVSPLFLSGLQKQIQEVPDQDAWTFLLSRDMVVTTQKFLKGRKLKPQELQPYLAHGLDVLKAMILKFDPQWLKGVSWLSLILLMISLGGLPLFDFPGFEAPVSMIAMCGLGEGIGKNGEDDLPIAKIVSEATALYSKRGSFDKNLLRFAEQHNGKLVEMFPLELVIYRGNGILILGWCGSGKSTLAHAVVKAGGILGGCDDIALLCIGKQLIGGVSKDQWVSIGYLTKDADGQVGSVSTDIKPNRQFVPIKAVVAMVRAKEHISEPRRRPYESWAVASEANELIKTLLLKTGIEPEIDSIMEVMLPIVSDPDQHLDVAGTILRSLHFASESTNSVRDQGTELQGNSDTDRSEPSVSFAATYALNPIATSACYDIKALFEYAWQRIRGVEPARSPPMRSYIALITIALILFMFILVLFGAGAGMYSPYPAPAPFDLLGMENPAFSLALCGLGGGVGGDSQSDHSAASAVEIVDISESFREVNELGLGTDVVFIIKGEGDAEERFARYHITTKAQKRKKGFYKLPTRGLTRGCVISTSMSHPLDLNNPLWKLTGNEIRGFDRSQNIAAIGMANEIVVIELDSGKHLRTIKHPKFAHIHSVVFSPYASHRVLISSTGNDRIFEVDLNTGDIVWEWNPWVHGYAVNKLGLTIITKEDEVPQGNNVRVLSFSEAEEMMLQDKRVPDGQLFVIRVAIDEIDTMYKLRSWQRTTYPNYAQYSDNPDKIFATLFRVGQLVEIDKVSGDVRVILKDLNRPHGLVRLQGYYFTNDTANGRIIQMDNDFVVRNIYSFAGLPLREEVKKRPLEWTQNSFPISQTLLATIDSRRSTVVVWDPNKRLYALYPYDPQVVLQDVMPMASWLGTAHLYPLIENIFSDMKELFDYVRARMRGIEPARSPPTLKSYIALSVIVLIVFIAIFALFGGSPGIVLPLRGWWETMLQPGQPPFEVSETALYAFPLLFGSLKNRNNENNGLLSVEQILQAWEEGRLERLRGKLETQGLDADIIQEQLQQIVVAEEVMPLISRGVRFRLIRDTEGLRVYESKSDPGICIEVDTSGTHARYFDNNRNWAGGILLPSVVLDIHYRRKISILLQTRERIALQGVMCVSLKTEKLYGSKSLQGQVEAIIEEAALRGYLIRHADFDDFAVYRGKTYLVNEDVLSVDKHLREENVVHRREVVLFAQKNNTRAKQFEYLGQILSQLGISAADPREDGYELMIPTEVPAYKTYVFTINGQTIERNSGENVTEQEQEIIRMSPPENITRKGRKVFFPDPSITHMNGKGNIPSRVLDAVVKFCSTLITDEEIMIKDAFLFGSYLIGDFSNESAIDLALYLDADSRNRFKRKKSRLAREFSRDTDFIIKISVAVKQKKINRFEPRLSIFSEELQEQVILATAQPEVAADTAAEPEDDIDTITRKVKARLGFLEPGEVEDLVEYYQPLFEFLKQEIEQNSGKKVSIGLFEFMAYLYDLDRFYSSNVIHDIYFDGQMPQVDESIILMQRNIVNEAPANIKETLLKIFNRHFRTLGWMEVMKDYMRLDRDFEEDLDIVHIEDCSVGWGAYRLVFNSRYDRKKQANVVIRRNNPGSNLINDVFYSELQNSFGHLYLDIESMPFYARHKKDRDKDILIARVFPGASLEHALNARIVHIVGAQRKGDKATETVERTLLRNIFLRLFENSVIADIIGRNDRKIGNTFLEIDEDDRIQIIDYDVSECLQPINYPWGLEDIRMGVTVLALITVLPEYQDPQSRARLISELEEIYVHRWLRIAADRRWIIRKIWQHYGLVLDADEIEEKIAVLNRRLRQNPRKVFAGIIQALTVDYLQRREYVEKLCEIFHDDSLAGREAQVRLADLKPYVAYEQGPVVLSLEAFRGILSQEFIHQLGPEYAQRRSIEKVCQRIDEQYARVFEQDDRPDINGREGGGMSPEDWEKWGKHARHDDGGRRSAQTLCRDLGWDKESPIMRAMTAEAVDLMSLKRDSAVVVVGPARFPHVPLIVAGLRVEVIIVQPYWYCDEWNQNARLRREVERATAKFMAVAQIDSLEKISYIDSLLEDAQLQMSSAQGIIMTNVSSFAPDEPKLFDAALRVVAHNGFILHGDAWVRVDLGTDCEILERYFRKYYEPRGWKLTIVREFHRLEHEGRAIFKLYQIQKPEGSHDSDSDHLGLAWAAPVGMAESIFNFNFEFSGLVIFGIAVLIVLYNMYGNVIRLWSPACPAGRRSRYRPSTSSGRYPEFIEGYRSRKTVTASLVTVTARRNGHRHPHRDHHRNNTVLFWMFALFAFIHLSPESSATLSCLPFMFGGVDDGGGGGGARRRRMTVRREPLTASQRSDFIKLAREMQDGRFAITEKSKQILTFQTLRELGFADRHLLDHRLLPHLIPRIIPERDPRPGTTFIFGQDRKFYYGLTAHHVIEQLHPFTPGEQDMQLRVGDSVVTAELLGSVRIHTSLEDYDYYVDNMFSENEVGSECNPCDFALFRVSKALVKKDGITVIIFPLRKKRLALDEEIPVIAYGSAYIFGIGGFSPEARPHSGIIIGLARLIKAFNRTLIRTFPTPSPHGYSGGPLTDLRSGEVIGMLNAGNPYGHRAVAIAAPQIFTWIQDISAELNLRITMPRRLTMINMPQKEEGNRPGPNHFGLGLVAPVGVFESISNFNFEIFGLIAFGIAFLILLYKMFGDVFGLRLRRPYRLRKTATSSLVTVTARRYGPRHPNRYRNTKESYAGLFWIFLLIVFILLDSESIATLSCLPFVFGSMGDGGGGGGNNENPTASPMSEHILPANAGGLEVLRSLIVRKLAEKKRVNVAIDGGIAKGKKTLIRAIKEGKVGLRADEIILFSNIGDHLRENPENSRLALYAGHFISESSDMDIRVKIAASVDTTFRNLMVRGRDISIVEAMHIDEDIRQALRGFAFDLVIDNSLDCRLAPEEMARLFSQPQPGRSFSPPVKDDSGRESEDQKMGDGPIIKTENKKRNVRIHPLVDFRNQTSRIREREVPRDNTFQSDILRLPLWRVILDDIQHHQEERELAYYINAVQYGDIKTLIDTLRNHRTVGWNINLTVSNIRQQSLEVALSAIEEESDIPFNLDVHPVLFDNRDALQVKLFRGMVGDTVFTGMLCNMGGAYFLETEALAHLFWEHVAINGWIESDFPVLLNNLIDIAKLDMRFNYKHALLAIHTYYHQFHIIHKLPLTNISPVADPSTEPGDDSNRPGSSHLGLGWFAPLGLSESVSSFNPELFGLIIFGITFLILLYKMYGNVFGLRSRCPFRLRRTVTSSLVTVTARRYGPRYPNRYRNTKESYVGLFWIFLLIVFILLDSESIATLSCLPFVFGGVRKAKGIRHRNALEKSVFDFTATDGEERNFIEAWQLVLDKIFGEDTWILSIGGSIVHLEVDGRVLWEGANEVDVRVFLTPEGLQSCESLEYADVVKQIVAEDVSVFSQEQDPETIIFFWSEGKSLKIDLDILPIFILTSSKGAPHPLDFTARVHYFHYSPFDYYIGSRDSLDVLNEELSRISVGRAVEKLADRYSSVYGVFCHQVSEIIECIRKPKKIGSSLAQLARFRGKEDLRLEVVRTLQCELERAQGDADQDVLLEQRLREVFGEQQFEFDPRAIGGKTLREEIRSAVVVWVICLFGPSLQRGKTGQIDEFVRRVSLEADLPLPSQGPTAANKSLLMTDVWERMRKEDNQICVAVQGIFLGTIELREEAIDPGASRRRWVFGVERRNCYTFTDNEYRLDIYIIGREQECQLSGYCKLETDEDSQWKMNDFGPVNNEGRFSGAGIGLLASSYVYQAINHDGKSIWGSTRRYSIIRIRRQSGAQSFKLNNGTWQDIRDLDAYWGIFSFAHNGNFDIDIQRGFSIALGSFRLRGEAAEGQWHRYEVIGNEDAVDEVAEDEVPIGCELLINPLTGEVKRSDGSLLGRIELGPSIAHSSLPVCELVARENEVGIIKLEGNPEDNSSPPRSLGAAAPEKNSALFGASARDFPIGRPQRVLILMPFWYQFSEKLSTGSFHFGQFLLASILDCQPGIEVRVLPIDAWQPRLTEELRIEIEAFDPDYVFLSAYDLNLRSMGRFIRELKDLPLLPWIGAGGRSPTSNLENAKYLGADFLFRGAGEEGALELIAVLNGTNRMTNLDAVTQERLNAIVGLWLRSFSGEICGRCQEVACVGKETLEQTPWRWDLLKDLFKGLGPRATGSLVVMASRYCRGRCTYCFEQDVDNFPLVVMGEDEFLARLAEVEAKISEGVLPESFRNIRLDADNDFFAGRDSSDIVRFFTEFNRRFKGRLIISKIHVKANNIKNIPPAVLRHASENRITLVVGIDYFNDADLKRTRRGFRVQDIFAAIERLERYQVPYMIYEIATTPWTSPGEYLTAVANRLRLGIHSSSHLHNKTFDAGARFVIVEPSTALFRQMREQGMQSCLVVVDDLRLQPFEMLPGERPEDFTTGIVYPQERLTLEMLGSTAGRDEFLSHIDDPRRMARGSRSGVAYALYNGFCRAVDLYRQVYGVNANSIVAESEAMVEVYDQCLAAVAADLEFQEKSEIAKRLFEQDPLASFVLQEWDARRPKYGIEDGSLIARQILERNIQLWCTAQRDYFKDRIQRYRERGEQERSDELQRMRQWFAEPVPSLLEALEDFDRRIGYDASSDIPFSTVLVYSLETLSIYNMLMSSIFFTVDVLLEAGEVEEAIAMFGGREQAIAFLTRYEVLRNFTQSEDEQQRAAQYRKMIEQFADPHKSLLATWDGESKESRWIFLGKVDAGGSQAVYIYAVETTKLLSSSESQVKIDSFDLDIFCSRSLIDVETEPDIMDKMDPTGVGSVALHDAGKGWQLWDFHPVDSGDSEFHQRYAGLGIARLVFDYLVVAFQLQQRALYTQGTQRFSVVRHYAQTFMRTEVWPRSIAIDTEVVPEQNQWFHITDVDFCGRFFDFKNVGWIWVVRNYNDSVATLRLTALGNNQYKVEERYVEAGMKLGANEITIRFPEGVVYAGEEEIGRVQTLGVGVLVHSKTPEELNP